MAYALWIVQGLLALVFLFAGGVKLVLPLEEMTKQMPVPLPGLTPLAAAGLVIIMIGGPDGVGVGHGAAKRRRTLSRTREMLFR
jgi:hypothetical protein